MSVRRLILPIAIFASLAAGCGSEGGSSAETGTTAKRPPFTARFVELTDHSQNGKHWRDTAHGAFDWDARKGSVEIRSGNAASVVRIVQLGDVCFRRSEKAAWKQFSPRNIHNEPDPEGLCDEEFLSPRNELQSLREIYLPDEVEVVGREEVGGVTTTHYSLFVHATPENSQYDLWVDESETARRKRIAYWDSHDPVRTVTTRTYYDFGAEVKVAPPISETGE